MNIRRFSLINFDGEEYGLTVRGHFLHGPGGLGFEKESEVRRLGSLYVILDDAFAQGHITGDVFFPSPGAYGKYFEFIRFCQNGPLTLAYSVEGQEYRRKVRLGSVEKGELSGGGLDVSVTFDALSLFYRHYSLFGGGDGAGGGKVYDYEYSYTYSDFAQNTLTISSDSYADSPCTIFIYGEAVNPSWRHYVDGELYATGAVSATIDAGQKLMIDTTEIPYSIARVDMANRMLGDLYAQGDFSTERFIMLRHGMNTVTVAHEAASALTLAMEAQIVYASV